MFHKEKYALCLPKHIEESMPGIKVISDKLHCLESVRCSAGKCIGVTCQVLCFFYIKHSSAGWMLSGRLRSG